VRISPFGGMLLAVFRGHKAEASRLLETTVKRATARGEGLGVQYAQWASAVLWNSLGRYEEALVSARAASSEDAQLFVAQWALIELVEAACRMRDTELGADGVARLTEATRGCDTDWGLGVVARCRALVSEGEAAEASFAEAIARLGRTP